MARNDDEYLESVNLNESADFPYLVLDVRDDSPSLRNPGFRVMHWHDDLQFIYVLEGDVVVKTLDSELVLRRGEGSFINKGVVHYVGRRGRCRYKSLIFPERFLEFYAGSPARSLVSRITGCSDVAALRLSPDGAWMSEALEMLRSLCALEDRKTEFYAYEVLTRLSSLWLLLIKNLDAPSPATATATERRMRDMLRYLAEHYAEHVALEDVAASAHVSKSECARCFKESLGTTPFKYLIELRLFEAARLLESTNLPIGEVAASVGFNQPSYFGKAFREKCGLTPREYRRAQRDRTRS